MGFGPMRFVEELLIFAFIIGLRQFIIRIWLPVGWSFAGSTFLIPLFSQYILLFAFGIIALLMKLIPGVKKNSLDVN